MLDLKNIAKLISLYNFKPKNKKEIEKNLEKEKVPMNYLNSEAY